MIPRSWSWDPAALAAAGVAIALYAQAFVRLRRRSPRFVGIRNAALFLSGVVLGTLAVVSPLNALAEDTLLSAHMAQHLLIGDLAPLLLVLGARGPSCVFLLPAPILRPLARSRLRTVVEVLLRPAVSFAVWAVALAAWHVPRAYDLALDHPAVHVLEHASLFLGGLLLWIQIVYPARRHRLSPGRRAAFAAAGLTYASDQSRATLLMMLEEAATLGVAAALLLWNHVERLERSLAT